MASHHPRARPEPLAVRPQFTQAGELDEVPRDRIPAAEMPADTAYQIVSDELLLDGNARLNLATFVTTWMEPHARRLMTECADRNLVDRDEYPMSAELERRCVQMLSGLWHGAQRDATGCSTTGSSEACMLAGLALLRSWRARGGTGRPNLVMGADVQVCWEKFCTYWDVEARVVPMAPGRTTLTPDVVPERCDASTIGVVCILGSTFDGRYEDVKGIAAALDALQDERGLDVPIHVDGASGGFVAPFLDQDLEWDFRVPRVRSINASGHKYGLVFPGLGWVLWRDAASLPEELVFRVNYLGGEMPTFSLTFSRPGSQVAAQYYTFLRLGFDGYRRVQQASRDTARWLAAEIDGIEPFSLLSDGSGIPAFAFRLPDGHDAFSVFDVSMLLRVRGWIVPAYTLPPDLEDVAVLRIVVRNGFSRDLAGLLLDDLRHAVARLERGGGADPERATGFHH